MRTEIIIQGLTPYIQAEMGKLLEKLSETWDTGAFETGVRQIMDKVEAYLLQIAWNAHLADTGNLKQLKQLGAKLGMKFKEYRCLTIRLRSGQQIRVNSPYFLKAAAKRGRKKVDRMDAGSIWVWLVWGLKDRHRQTV